MWWLSIIICWFVILIIDSRAATLSFFSVSNLNYVASQLHLSSILRCSVVSWMENGLYYEPRNILISEEHTQSLHGKLWFLTSQLCSCMAPNFTACGIPLAELVHHSRSSDLEWLEASFHLSSSTQNCPFRAALGVAVLVKIAVELH